MSDEGLKCLYFWLWLDRVLVDDGVKRICWYFNKIIDNLEEHSDVCLGAIRFQGLTLKVRQHDRGAASISVSVGCVPCRPTLNHFQSAFELMGVRVPDRRTVLYAGSHEGEVCSFFNLNNYIIRYITKTL